MAAAENQTARPLSILTDDIVVMQLELQHQAALQDRMVVIRDHDEMPGAVGCAEDIQALHIVDLISGASREDHLAIQDSTRLDIPTGYAADTHAEAMDQPEAPLQQQ